MINSSVANGIKWVVTLCMPFLFGFTMITLVIRPWYPRWEYARPSFPPDLYGWSQAQRLELALVAVDYLQQRAPASETIYMLEEQTLPDGSGPLYNTREIDHMVDVKVRTDAIRRAAWGLALVVVGGLTVLLARRVNERAAYLALRNGGYATVLILLAIGGFLLLAWETFFVQFHELLFPPGTWTFAYSDSLIRLFPEKFWFDVGTIIVGGTFALGVLAALVGALLVRQVVPPATGRTRPKARRKRA